MKYVNKNLFLSAIASVVILIASCSVNKAEIDNSLKKYFDSAHVEGCFSFFNNATGGVKVYNMEMDTQRFTPASTFKIVNSLIGLETGKITGEKMMIKWDGVKRWNDKWNQDLTLDSAFKFSAVPYFQEVARRIGKDTMQQWIDTLGYGNKDISGAVDSFWLINHLKVSPDEQLGLVRKLFFDKLPFRKGTMETVRNIMLRENNTLYKLSYKTGWGFDELNRSLGWVVGYIEENRHVYFFVTLIRSDIKDDDVVGKRMKITRSILSQYGFFKGEM